LVLKEVLVTHEVGGWIGSEVGLATEHIAGNRSPQPLRTEST